VTPVRDLIPHRPPWALVDRVVAAGEGVVTAEKRVSAGDPLVGDGGFGGPLVVEAAAQAAACLMGLRGGGVAAGHRGYLVSARGWKFPSAAAPGETVTIEARQVSALGTFHGFEAVARVGEREIASGQMTFAVTFDG
jgi:3-hydroxyacyl-[acyl-carrier-protein] dehydratase